MAAFVEAGSGYRPKRERVSLDEIERHVSTGAKGQLVASSVASTTSVAS